MREALGASAELAALVSDRIYDQVPPKAVLPYVTLGVVQEVDASVGDPECGYQGVEAVAQVDCWSRHVGYPNVKLIAEACRRALSDPLPVIPGLSVQWFRFDRTLVLRDPDGITSHAVIEFISKHQPA
jgi:hypothetical protein